MITSNAGKMYENERINGSQNKMNLKTNVFTHKITNKTLSNSSTL